LKQALPYVRLVGESWPLPLSRAHYEYLALSKQADLAPGLVPALLHHNETLALTVMELLEPHIIMRKGLVAAAQYPRFAGDITPSWRGRCSSRPTSRLSAAEKKEGIAAFAGNHALCKITEDLIFTDPYRIAEQNRWTAPYLDGLAASLRDDMDLHVAISRLKLKFMASPEALLHGDLHTGSIMVTDSQTRVIDPEFAFYGPMGFDVGAVLANLLMAYFASAGHERAPGERAAFEGWVLETVEQVWNEFARKFLDLWRAGAAGDAYPGLALRRRDGRGAAGGRAAGLHAAPVRRCGRLRRGQNHPPHLRPRPQHRFRADRGSAEAGDQRGARRAAGAGDDGGGGGLPIDRRRHRRRAKAAGLDAGVCERLKADALQ
jgi:5-methylthioribose kinase